jgi:hypothetical protein
MVKILKVGKTKSEVEKKEADEEKGRLSKIKRDAIAFLEGHRTLNCQKCSSLLEAGIIDLKTDDGFFYYIQCPNCDHNNMLFDYDDYIIF